MKWLGRALRALRRDGIRIAALKLMARSFLRYVVLFQVNATEVAPSRASVPVQVLPLRLEDVPAHLRFRPDVSEEEVRARLAQGHLCFATWTEDEISSAVWFRHDVIWIPALDRSIELEDGSSYCYDSWTRPDMRGRSIVAARAVAKLGARPYGSVGVLQIGMARVEFFRRHGRPTEWSIRRSQRPLRRESAALQH
jgi:hypothetical protein